MPRLSYAAHVVRRASRAVGRVTRDEAACRTVLRGARVTARPTAITEASSCDRGKIVWTILHNAAIVTRAEAQTLLWLGDETLASTLAKLDQDGRVGVQFDRVGGGVQYKTP